MNYDQRITRGGETVSWTKLDDQFFTHPKVIDLPKDAKLLYLSALTYCAGQLTDGIVTAGALRVIAATVDVSRDDAATLVDAGLWEICENGWQVHDYHEYNPAATKVKEHKQDVTQKRSEAGSKGAANRWQTNDNADSKTNDKTIAPSPSPSQSKDDPNGSLGGKPPANSIPKITKRPLPSEEDVQKYFAEKGRAELWAEFWDYWQSVGWKRRGQTMTDWQAGVRTWIAKAAEITQSRSEITRSRSAPARASPPSAAETVRNFTAQIERAVSGH